ncbi:MAG: deoxyribose-phosphate aldolase [Planctomycetes bacterium]|nr:deoxyribose-phosphate aldolase [Planctomycetota bacterium]
MSNASRIKTIALGADHAGYELKEHLKGYLQQRGYEIADCGTHGTASVDYPEFAAAVARHVADGSCARGIVVDGAGIGSAIVANKIPGVRAALCYDESSARNSREHNDANVLTLGAGLIGRNLAERVVDVWLTAECTVDRHRRRVAQIAQVEQGGHLSSRAETSCATAAPSAAAPSALNDEDIQRIVTRITELGAAGGEISGDLASLFCQVCVETSPESMRQLIEAGAARIGHRPGRGALPKDLAGYIDHTLLRPEASAEDIRKLCAEAREHEFASVCINPTWVKLAASELRGTAVVVCAVTGFPLGAHVPEIKGLETRRAIRDGAREIDMVINVGALKSGDCDLVLRDIRAVTDACMERRVICKVIIEAALLTDEEKVVACRLSRQARADFVKTSTGFGPGGATAHDVALMSQAVRDTKMGVKAAGGIRSLEDAQKMIAAGATRIGASAGVKILKEATGVTVSA